jgi:hypothetical protein
MVKQKIFDGRYQSLGLHLGFEVSALGQTSSVNQRSDARYEKLKRLSQGLQFMVLNGFSCWSFRLSWNDAALGFER